jgi:hypothetical protein
MDILNRTSPSGNLGTNPHELHTPTSNPKKPKGDDGDKKKKLKHDKVFCEDEVE